MDNDNSSKPVTKFNAGIAKLERIDALKRAGQEARFNKDYEGWADSLKALRSEISAEISREELKKLKKDFESKIDNKLIIVGNKRKINATVIRSLYNCLDDYSDRLEQLEKRTGLGMPNKNRDDFAAEQ